MIVEPIRVDLHDGGFVSARLHVPEAPPTGVGLVLGHGAGTTMEHPLLVAVAAGLADHGHEVLRFNFPYTELGRRAPDRPAVLQRAFRAAINVLRDRRPARLVLGGRSMGGRMASLLAAEGEPCDGLVFLAYPLHPAGQPHKIRDGHLDAIQPTMLFIEGTRDPLCDLALLRPVLARLGDRASLHVIEGGDHSFHVPKSAQRSKEAVCTEIVTAIDSWLRFGGRSGPS